MNTVNNINQLLDKMWKDYVGTNPDAGKIHDLFVARGDKVINDHIALRTFDHKKVSVDVIAKPFLKSGYIEKGDYHFEDKKLYAKHYEHPDKNLPKIFISELQLSKFGPELNEIVNKLVAQIDDATVNRFDFSSMGRPWKCSTQDYNSLKKHSDYAAWVAAFGYRPNHFTVFINYLKSLSSIEELNNFVKKSGYKLNSSGGEIKGSKDVYLEQSSTIANNVDMEFTDGKIKIPSTYYEFAKRYNLADGNLYQGFVAKSADKIFESTNVGQ